MHVIKPHLDQFHERLANLSSAHKTLGMVVILLVVGILLWRGLAATRVEMVSLLEQPLSHTDLARITTSIQSRGIEYRVVGDRVLVPADRRQELISALAYAQLLPQDTRAGFDAIIRQISPWDSGRKSETLLNKANEDYFASVIRTFPDVAHATVMLNPHMDRRIGSTIHPSATVYISMKNRMPPSRHVIDGAADLVAGATAGLARSRVKVIVDGRAYTIRDRAEGSLATSSDLMDQIAWHERYIAGKITEALADISGLLVSVTVNLNEARPQQIGTRSDEPVTTAAADDRSWPPILGPVLYTGTAGSTDMAAANAGAAAAQPAIPRSPRGPAVVAVSVRVPRSYFVHVFTRGSAVIDPDDASLTPVIERELASIRNTIRGATGLMNDDAIMVDMYTDMMPATESALQQPPAATPLAALRDRRVALGGLALVSIFMAMVIARRSGAAPAGVTQPAAERLRYGVADMTDEAPHRVSERASAIVAHDPDAAAALVSRWLRGA